MPLGWGQEQSDNPAPFKRSASSGSLHPHDRAWPTQVPAGLLGDTNAETDVLENRPSLAGAEVVHVGNRQIDDTTLIRRRGGAGGQPRQSEPVGLLAHVRPRPWPLLHDRVGGEQRPPCRHDRWDPIL